MTKKYKRPADTISCWAAVLVLLSFLPAAAWAGFVIHVLWGWFVVPLGVPSIELWQAAGLTVLGSMLAGDTRDLVTNKRSGEEALLRIFSVYTLTPALCLLLGLIYHALS